MSEFDGSGYDLMGKMVLAITHDRHVYAGKVNYHNARWVHLSPCANVRYWPANEIAAGLGAMTLVGPRLEEGAVLDVGYELRIPALEQVHFLECDAVATERWESFFQSKSAPVASAYPDDEFWGVLVAHDKHVYAGKVDSRDPQYLCMSPLVNIRYWPAEEDSRGLVSIAMCGPRAESRLDPAFKLHIPVSARVHMLTMTQEASDMWETYFKNLPHPLRRLELPEPQE